MADMIAKIGANISEYLSAMDEVVNKASATVDKVEGRFAAFENVGASLAKVGAGLTAAITLPILGVGGASIKAAADMEQARIGFTTLLKSGEAAGVMLDKLREFALKTPFNFPDLVTGAQRLLAMGTSAQDLIPKMTAIGNATSAMGKGMETFDGIALALSQMGNSAKATAQDMNQLIQRGIDPFKYLSEASGKSIGEIRGHLGELFTGAEASQIILAGMTKQFAGAMDAQSKSLTGMWSNVQDAIKFTLADIGATLLPTAKTVVENFVVPVLEGLKSLAHWFASLPEPIKMGALAMVGLAAAVGPLLLLVGGLGMALPAISSGLVAIGALGGMISSFGALLVTVIGTLATFAMTAIPAAIVAVANFSTALLVNAAGSLSTFATSAIPAAIAALGTFVAVTIPSAIAALVSFAATAIPAAITGLGTLATVSIPAAISGFMSLATGGIASAAAGMASMASASIPYLVGTLSVLGVAALSVGAAFAGWKIGSILLENIPLLQRLNGAIGDLLVRVPLLGSALERLYGIQAITDSSTKILSDSTEKLRQYLAAKGVTVDRGSLSLEEYNKRLIVAAKGLGQAGDAAALAKKAAEDHAAAVKAANAELKLAEKVLSETKKLYSQGAASQQDVAAALEKVRIAAAKVHPELTQTGKTTAEASKALRDYNKELKASETQYRTFTAQQAAHVIKLQETKAAYDQAADELELLTAEIVSGKGPLDLFAHALDGVKLSTDRLAPDMKTLAAVLTDVGADAAKAADSLGDAFKRQRITSSTELKATADQAARDLQTISAAHGTTRGEVDAAWRAMMEAEIAYRKSLGDDVSALEAQLAKYDNAHKNLQKNVRDTWDQIRRDISAAADNFGRSISDLGRDLLSGDFSLSRVGDAFKQLGLDIASAFMDVAGRAIADFIKNHIGSLLSALDGVMSKIPGIGSALGGVFGGGGGVSTLPAPSGLPGGLGGVFGGGSSGGSAGAVAGSGVAGIVGAVGSVASAVSGIIGNFQMAGMNKTLDLMEKSARYTEAYMLALVIGSLEYWPKITGIWEYLWTVSHDAAAELITEVQHTNDWLHGVLVQVEAVASRIETLEMYAIGTFELIRDEIVSRLAGTNQTGPVIAGPSFVDSGSLESLGSTLSDSILALGQSIKANVTGANITLAPTIDASGQMSTMNSTLSGISMMMARGLGLTAPKGGEFEFVSPSMAAAIGHAENAVVNAVIEAGRYLLAPLDAMVAATAGGPSITIDLRGANISGNDMVDRLADQITSRIRSVTR